MDSDQIFPIEGDELHSLETHLSRTLKRVTPPNGLIERLRERIQIPTRSEIRLRLKDWRRLIFIFGGVMSGMFLLVTLARMFYYFVGRRNVM